MWRCSVTGSWTESNRRWIKLSYFFSFLFLKKTKLRWIHINRLNCLESIMNSYDARILKNKESTISYLILDTSICMCKIRAPAISMACPYCIHVVSGHHRRTILCAKLSINNCHHKVSLTNYIMKSVRVK